MATDQKPETSVDVPRGAIITTAYAERKVRVLAVLESEVHSISAFNTLATTFFSIGSALISIAIGIWANGAFAEKLTPEGIVLSKFVSPLLCFLAILMYAIAIWAVRSRRNKLDVIRTESKSTSGPSPLT